MKIKMKKSKPRSGLVGVTKKKKRQSSVENYMKKSKKLKQDDAINSDEDDLQEETLMQTEDDSDPDSDNVNGDNSDVENYDGAGHKKALEKLKETDPEFYKYLEENDKALLDFNDDDEDDDDEEEKIHQPPKPGELEVNSDEEDYEDEKALRRKSKKHLTLKTVSTWQEELQTDKTNVTIVKVVRAFHAAIVCASGGKEEDDPIPLRYIVEGNAVFNAVVQLCVLELQPALVRNLKLPTDSSELSKCNLSLVKSWPTFKKTVKFYCIDLLKLMSGISSDNILSVILKHTHQMLPFIVYFQRIVKRLVTTLVSLWSGSNDETIRVLAFLCILRITTSRQKRWLEPALRKMYSAYVRNSKFVSPSTLPGINFMRRSLTEILSIDSNITYHHAFLYIRQLAIHLRNAITLNKKESIQAVYNWQYINSLHLWSDVICYSYHKPQLQMLLYPLVQIIIGCIRLVPTARYYPLRFQCCEMLIELNKETGVYIPVLPLVLEVLTITDFDKDNKKLSMRPMDLSTILRLSKSMLLENAFKDAVVEQVYRLLLETLSAESHRLSFPDLTLLPILQLKSFFKKCKATKYINKLRGAVNKIEENVKFIENERRKVSFVLNDKKAIEAWERTIEAKGTPLNIFNKQLKKIYVQEQAKRITQNDELGNFNLPVRNKGEKQAGKEELGLSLHDGSSDDEEALLGLNGNKVKSHKTEAEEQNKESAKKKKKEKKKNTNEKITNSANEENVDINDEKDDHVVDFTFSDSE